MSNLFNTESTENTRPPRRILIWLLPLILVLSMAAILFFSGWKSLLPQIEVDVARARIGEAAVSAKEGETLFQAAGWVQADPYTISVTSLISGVVEKIHVIDGEKVTKGQLLVEIIDDDIKLQLAKEKARLTELELDKKEKELVIVTKNAELEKVNRMEETGEAVAKKIKHKADTYRKAKDALPEFETEQAELEYREQIKRVAEYSSQKKILRSEIELAKLAVEAAAAKIATQKTVIEKVELDLSRTKIHSPADGIINELFAREGRKQMLGSDNEKSTTVATIFSTKKIQVHVDVPLIDIPKVKIGQKTFIHTEAVKEPLEGVVYALHGKADYQKNTLSVHVSIIGGHPDLRPDMIAQVMFLSDAPAKEVAESKVSGVFIKKEAVVNGTEAWIVNADQKAEKRSVSTGGNENDGWIQVKSGINAGEKVILSPPASLKEGLTVKAGKIYE
ncbi:MAG: efflux RND transporter periplasmic adaptor subunit [Lentisphaeraceae bacterium]|nr:efflux RND transporter periplasmic adaptor subunit [Lentisphaeraceae bacterium]